MNKPDTWPIPKSRIRRLFNIVFSVLFIVLCSIVIGAILGVFLNKLVPSQHNAGLSGMTSFVIKAVTFSGSVIVLIKHLGRITEYFQLLWAHWVGLEPLHLGVREGGVALSFILVSAYVAIDLWQPPGCVVCPPTIDVKHEQIIYPFLYEENATRIRGDWATGMRLSDEQKKGIKYIVEGLSGCAPGDGVDSVIVEVSGYASYSPFRGQRKTGSDSLNIVVSDMRRDTLIHYLNTYIDSLDIRPKIEIDTVAWSSYDEMMYNRSFKDSSNWPSSDHLTRVAEIRILSAGQCKQIELAASN